MTIDKFKRVIWRLREFKTEQPNKYSNKQIRLAIMQEIGTDTRTIEVTIKTMTELGLLHKEELGFMSTENV